MTGNRAEKIKARRGGAKAGRGADSQGYLLPQVVGETSGMRGREPPVIHRVETLDTYVARGKLFFCQPTRQPPFLFLRTLEVVFGC